MPAKTTVLIIQAPHFAAGIVFEPDGTTKIPPILHYMRGWSFLDIIDYVGSRTGWSYQSYEVEP